MPFGVTFVELDGQLFVEGQIDEFVDLTPILAPRKGLLKVDLRGVRAINSLGLKKLIDAMREFGDRQIEFHACTQPFIEAVNTFPLAVGGQSKVARVRSVIAPMACEDGHKQSILIGVDQVMIATASTVRLPRILCPTCRLPLSLEHGMTPEDYFFFLIA